MTTAQRIRRKCREIAAMLVVKNRSYGDSALRPLGIFASGDPILNLAARIDDKLARLKAAPSAYGEDTLKDLIGYLILLQLALEDRRHASRQAGGRNCAAASAGRAGGRTASASAATCWSSSSMAKGGGR